MYASDSIYQILNNEQSLTIEINSASDLIDTLNNTDFSNYYKCYDDENFSNPKEIGVIFNIKADLDFSYIKTYTHFVTAKNNTFIANLIILGNGHTISNIESKDIVETDLDLLLLEDDADMEDVFINTKTGLDLYFYANCQIFDLSFDNITINYSHSPFSFFAYVNYAKNVQFLYTCNIKATTIALFPNGYYREQPFIVDMSSDWATQPIYCALYFDEGLVGANNSLNDLETINTIESCVIDGTYKTFNFVGYQGYYLLNNRMAGDITLNPDNLYFGIASVSNAGSKAEYVLYNCPRLPENGSSTTGYDKYRVENLTKFVSYNGFVCCNLCYDCTSSATITINDVSDDLGFSYRALGLFSTSSNYSQIQAYENNSTYRKIFNFKSTDKLTLNTESDTINYSDGYKIIQPISSIYKNYYITGSSYAKGNIPKSLTSSTYRMEGGEDYIIFVHEKLSSDDIEKLNCTQISIV
jgi:hypothetical protein